MIVILYIQLKNILLGKYNNNNLKKKNISKNSFNIYIIFI